MTTPILDVLVAAIEASSGLPIPTSREYATRLVEQLDARGFEIVGQRPTVDLVPTGAAPQESEEEIEAADDAEDRRSGGTWAAHYLGPLDGWDGSTMPSPAATHRPDPDTAPQLSVVPDGVTFADGSTMPVAFIPNPDD